MLKMNKKLGGMSLKIKSDYSIAGALATLLTAIIFLTPFPLHSTTISFQDGVSPSAGYSGTRDTYLNVDQPDNNYGSSTKILIDGSPDYGTLLKWDVSTIPSGDLVQSATITLTAFNATSHTYEVYEMKRDWEESETTWNEYQSGDSWQTAGARGSQDRGSVVLGTITGSAGTVDINFNAAGIALVQSWVSNPGSNNGVIIQDYTGASDGMDFRSREYGTASNRPQLTVIHGSTGNTYYVRTDGNNGNSGTANTPSGAWKTIGKAAAVMVAGDTVRVQPGTYGSNGDHNINPTHSGLAGTPIVFLADGPGVVINGGNSGSRCKAFRINNRDYIVIDGFEITDQPDCEGSGAAIKVINSDYIVIRNNIIRDTGRDAIYFYGNSSNCLVENNLIYAIDDDGISPAGGGNHVIRNNTIYDCGGWAVEHANTSGNVYENNIIWDNIDNTGGSVTYSYNDYIDGVLSGTGNISSDPLFVSAAGNDFHLSHTASGQTSNSPCIDAGSTTAANLGLDTRTTRTDQEVDAGTVDLGYHYLTGVVTFTDWTSAAGLSGCTNEYGIGWGDYNNDGFPDLYITKRNALYENNGDGTFSTEPPYLYCGNRAGHWADYDNDGDLDFGSTYNMYFSKNNGDGTFTMQDNATMGFTHINNLGDFGWLDYNEDGYLDLWAPNGSNPYTYMYSNDGDGTFTGVAGSTIGLTANINGETTVVTDYDGDGHTDILYRANNLYLWHSNGDGTFTDVTSSAGVSLTGTSGGYNGTAFGDYDNDGDLDFYGGQTGSNKLYRNNNDGTFTDVTSAAGVAGSNKKTRGVAWGDYNNDGYLDLYVAQQNGSNQLFHNNGDGTFTDLAAGLGLNDGARSYGVAWADFDLDGDLDLFVGNKNHASKLFRNNLVDTDYLKVKVRGLGAGGAPLDGTGSRVELWNSAGTTLLAVREVSGGEGMGSHPPRIVHFGLADGWGGSSGTYSVKVKFTGGNQVTVRNVVPASRSITIGSTTLSQTIEVFEGSLIAELRLDECSWDGTANEVADSSGNAYHGTSYGGATTGDGKICKAGEFNGSTGYVLVSSTPPLSDFTYSIWVKPNSASSTGWHQVLSSWYTYWKDAFKMSISNNKVTIGVEDGSGYYVSSNVGSIQDGNWYHIVGVKEGNDLKLYLNGSYINSVGSVPSPFNGNPSDYAIGRNPHHSGGEYFSGMVDELLIYDKALSSTEVSSIYTNQLAGLNADGTSRTCRECEPPAPLALWRMDECEWTGASGEVADSSGNGYHGTAYGAITGEGRVCNGGIFDGSDDYVALDMFYSQTGQITQITSTAWVKTSVGGTGWSGNWAIIDFDRSEYFNLYVRGDNGKVGFSTTGSNGTIHDHSGNTPINDGQWHFVAGVYNGVDKIIYVDGVEDSRIANAHAGLPIGTGQTRYGFIGDGSEAGTFNGSRNQLYYDGTIDEVTIYNQALNADQVEYAYNETHPCPDCTPDPVALWYFDESSWTGASGEVIDSSGNELHGTAVGGLDTDDGKICKAGDFDGVDDYIEVPDDPNLDITGNLTIAMWVYPNSVSDENVMVSKGAGCGNYNLFIRDGKLGLLSSNNCNWVYEGNSSLVTTGAWQHIAATYDGSNIKYYVNGDLKDIVSYNNGLGTPNNDPLRIGGPTITGWSSSRHFDGMIDEVYIFDQALSSTNIQSLYSNTHSCPSYEVTHNIEYFPKNKWVLLGVPVLPDPADATSVVGDDFGSAPPYWRVVRWDTELLGYAFYQENGEGPYALPGEEPPEFAPGLGFWVIQSLHDQVTIDVDGVEMADNHSVDIVGPPTGASIGKNMMANPYPSVIDWSEVQVTDGSVTLSIIDAGTQGWVNTHAYTWNWQNSMYEVITPNTGSTGDSISVEEGFWVLQMDANKDLDLIFKKSSGQPKLLADNRPFVSRYGDEVRPLKRYEVQGLTDWSGILYLHTTDGVYNALDNRFGVDPNGQDGFDGLDASWFTPMASEYGALYFIAPDGTELVHDIRNPEWTEQNWHFKVVDANVNGSWQLRWPNVTSIPGSIQLSLESPQGTVVVSELRNTLSYDFSLTSGSDRDFYLHAQVVEDSLSASMNIGFVQNPGISRYLDLYLFPDEPLDFMLVFVDGAPTPASNVDPLYNVYGGSLEMSEGGQKEIVVHTMDLALNQGIDTLQYNFILSDSSALLLVQAPDDRAALSIPGGILPANSWVGIGVQSSRTAEALGPVYSIQPFGLTLPEGSELILSGTEIEDLVGNANVYRETSYGRQLVRAIYEPITGTIHVPVRQSGQYILLKSDEGVSGILPLQTSLLDNYPNPFNATTVIPYMLQGPALVSIKLYDLLGREVVELVNKYQPAGYYRVTWNGRDRYGKSVSSGIYLIHYRAGSYTRTNKLMLLK